MVKGGQNLPPGIGLTDLENIGGQQCPLLQVPASLKSALDGTKVIVKAYFLFIIYSSVFSKDELSPTKPIIICKNQA